MGTSDHKDGSKNSKAQPSRSALGCKPLPLARLSKRLASGESTYSWPSSPRGTGSLHQLLLGAKTTLRDFTSVNSPTPYGRLLQIWIGGYIEINGEKGRV